MSGKQNVIIRFVRDSGDTNSNCDFKVLLLNFISENSLLNPFDFVEKNIELIHFRCFAIFLNIFFSKAAANSIDNFKNIENSEEKF